MASQLRALLASRFASLKYSLLSNTKRKNNRDPLKADSKGRVILYAILFIYLFAALGFMFFGLFSELAEPYHLMGLDWLFFTMFAIMDFGLMFIGTVFTAKVQLFEAKDNDLLLSMPIKPGYILISRMGLLLGINFFFGFLVSAPILIAWIINTGVNAGQIAAFLLIALLLPFFAAAVAALFGWLLSLLTRRVRQKALMTTVFSLLFFGAYFVLVSRMNTFIAKLASNGLAVADKLGAVAPLYWIGNGIGGPDGLCLLKAAAFLVIPFVFCCIILSMTFIKTVTSNHGFSKVKYRERAVRQKTPLSALYGREFSRLMSSSIYLLNSAIGAVMTFAAGIILICIQGKINDVLTLINFPKDILAGGLILLGCMLSSLTIVAASAVSMEGKNLWIAQSLPVNSSTVLKAKLLVHLTFSLPSTIMAAVGILFVARPDPLTALCGVILMILFSCASAVLDLALNLRFPIIEWTSENQAVKTGLSVLLAMFLPWGIVLLMGLGGWFALKILPLWAIFAAYSLLLATLTLILYRWNMKRGAEIFNNL